MPKLTLKKDKENGERKESKKEIRNMENTTNQVAIDQKPRLVDTFKILFRNPKYINFYK